jgi:hypothetical protein
MRRAVVAVGVRQKVELADLRGGVAVAAEHPRQHLGIVGHGHAHVRHA